MLCGAVLEMSEWVIPVSRIYKKIIAFTIIVNS